MSHTLAIVLPVFAVILLGYGVGKTRLFGDEGVKALTTFCFFVAIPAVLFRAMAQLDAPRGSDFTVVIAFYAAVLVAYALAMAAGRLLFRLSLAEQAIFAVGATYSNILLLGIPLVVTAFGPRAALPQSAILALQSVILISLTSFIVEAARGREGGAGAKTGIGAILKSAGVALATNPIIVSMVAGFAWGRTGLGLHEIVEKSLVFLGQAAVPTALFALGASLTRFHLGGDLRQVAVLGLIKLALLPALVFASAKYLFGLEALPVAVATISAAMPTGVNAFVLAMRYDTLVARVAAAVIATTALAWAIAAALLAWMLPGIG
jgi:malonate transporter and related proteins